MNRGPGRVWGALMAALALLALLLGAPARAQEGAVAWGKQLVETQEMSAEGLARFLQTQERNARLRPGTDPASDTWSGREMNLASTGSPYTLVLRATGVVLADGDAGVRMQTGWVFDGKTTQLPMPDIAQKGCARARRWNWWGCPPRSSWMLTARARPWWSLRLLPTCGLNGCRSTCGRGSGPPCHWSR